MSKEDFRLAIALRAQRVRAEVNIDTRAPQDYVMRMIEAKLANEIQKHVFATDSLSVDDPDTNNLSQRYSTTFYLLTASDYHKLLRGEDDAA